MLLSSSRKLGEAISCAECAEIALQRILECAGSLGIEFQERCFSWQVFRSCSDCWDSLVSAVLLAVACITGFLWLVLPQDSWLCGYTMLGVSALSGTLWNTLRELRVRHSLQQSAQQLELENHKLRAATEEMSSDLDMLKSTIGAIGDKGDDWLSQLRVLHMAQKRENDRHSMLLRGHARIVLLQ